MSAILWHSGTRIRDQPRFSARTMRSGGHPGLYFSGGSSSIPDETSSGFCSSGQKVMFLGGSAVEMTWTGYFPVLLHSLSGWSYTSSLEAEIFCCFPLVARASREISLGAMVWAGLCRAHLGGLLLPVLIILKDDPEAKDWYCAEVRSILADRIEVNYFTTQTSALEEHGKCTVQDRKERLSEALFLRTWCLNGGKGDPTTTPLSTKYARLNHLWWGKIPMGAVSNYILIRDVGLDATGRLDQITLNLAAKLKLPHHVGAGEEEDFTDKEEFQKHVRRVSNRNKKKK